MLIRSLYGSCFQGLYFDPTAPGVMKPLTNNAGMRRALEIYREIMSYNAPSSSSVCTGMSQDFLMGRCALTFNWDFNFILYNGSAVANQSLYLPPGSFGISQMPGSTQVSQKLSLCA